MQNSSSKFYNNSFQSNFIFVHFSPLNFKFIQLKTLPQLPLNFLKIRL